MGSCGYNLHDLHGNRFRHDSFFKIVICGEMAPGIDFMYDVSLNFLHQEQVVDAHRSVCQCGI